MFGNNSFCETAFCSCPVADVVVPPVVPEAPAVDSLGAALPGLPGERERLERRKRDLDVAAAVIILTHLRS